MSQRVLRPRTRQPNYAEVDEKTKTPQEQRLFSGLTKVATGNNSPKFLELAAKEGYTEIVQFILGYRRIEEQHQFCIVTTNLADMSESAPRWELAECIGRQSLAQFLAQNESLVHIPFFRQIQKEFQLAPCQLFDLGSIVKHRVEIHGIVCDLLAKVEAFDDKRQWSWLPERRYKISYVELRNQLPRDLKKYAKSIQGGWVFENELSLDHGGNVIALEILRKLLELSLRALPEEESIYISSTRAFWIAPSIVQNYVEPALDHLEVRTTSTLCTWLIVSTDDFAATFCSSNKSIKHAEGTASIHLSEEMPFEIVLNKQTSVLRAKFNTEWDASVE